MPSRNDYELLFLAKYEQSEVALDCIFHKYDSLIYKIIHRMNVNYELVEDYHQEGMMMLLKAVNTFDEMHCKTFTKYFELIFTRRIINLKKHEAKYVLLDDFCGLESHAAPMVKEDNDEVIFNFKNPLEQLIFDDRIKNGLSVSEICQKNNLSKKKVYNTIYRITKRCKNFYD